MIPTETVGNPGMEAEYLASCILRGNINPLSYLNLRMNLAGLSFIEAAPELTELLAQIQKKVVGTQGLIDRPVVKDLYYDKADELKALIEASEAEVANLIDLYGEAVPQKLDELMMNMENDINSAPMTFEDVGEAVNKYSLDNDHLTQLDQTQTELRRMQGVLQAILRICSEDNPKLTKKDIPAKLTPDYKMYLNDLSSDSDVATDNMQISMTLFTAMDAIISTFPKDDLDPYLTDVCNNMIEVMTNPMSFYSMCKNDEIISSSVGQMFGHAYPELYNKYLDMYMETYESMPEQEVREFRKCFGLDSDDSEMTNLCAQYVKLGFTQQQ